MTAPDPDLDTLLGHVPWVRKLAIQLCRDVHLAEDAAQEAWLMAARGQPRGGGRIRAYLARILRNVLHRDGRTRRRRVRREDEFARLRHEEALDPADAVARAELYRALVEAVLQLPSSQREVVLLHHFEGIEIAAVAARCGRSQDAVRAALRRAREDLRVTLERRGAQFSAVVLSFRVEAAQLVPLTVTWGAFVMKTKVWITAAAALLLCLSIPFFVERGASTMTNGPAEQATARAAVGIEHEAQAAQPQTTPVERVAVPVAANTIAGQLVGLDARLPWSSQLLLTASWRAGAQVAQHEASINIEREGRFSCRIPQWDASSADLRLQLRADDPSYESFDVTLDVTEATRETIAQEVFAAPILMGRTVALDGTAVAGAQILCFAAKDGIPTAGRLGEKVSGQDGSWRVRLPAASEVFVVGVPSPERADLVVAGIATSVRGITDLGELRMNPSSSVTGTVRWRNGAPIDGAEVSWGCRSAVVLDKDIKLGWSEGRVHQGRSAVADRAGRFLLPAAKGEAGTVSVKRAAGCLPATFNIARATAPQDVEVFVDGRPVTIRVLCDGEPAGRSGIEWRRDVVAGNYATDELGVLRQLVMEEPMRLRAKSMDRERVSEWMEFDRGAVPEELVLQLLPPDGERVVVRLEGADLTDVGFVWTSQADPAVRRTMTLRQVDGVFVMRVPGGEQRLSLAGVSSGASQYLLPTALEVVVPPPGEVVVPVRIGGRLRLAVTDRSGVFLAGKYRLLRDGIEVAAGPSPRGGAAPSATKSMLAGREHFTETYEPGTYELVLDLGAYGESRRTVTIVAGSTEDVRVTVP